MRTSLALLTIGADVWRLFQLRAAFRYISVTDLVADMIRTLLASVKVASVDRSIFADGVAKTLPSLDAVIFAFRSQRLNKATMIADLS